MKKLFVFLTLFLSITIAKVLDIPLDDVAYSNFEKTQGRVERGTQSGSGDDR